MTINYKNLFEYKNGNLFWKMDRSFNAKAGSIAGSISGSGYKQVTINKKVYSQHRIIFFMHYGYMPLNVDHINGNKTDNRIENLREATKTENNINQGINKTNTSGIKNVSFCKQTNRWLVTIRINKKQKHVGRFKDKELAELVAIEAREKYHKEFANHVNMDSRA